jgi:hypothetical protein
MWNESAQEVFAMLAEANAIPAESLEEQIFLYLDEQWFFPFDDRFGNYVFTSFIVGPESV